MKCFFLSLRAIVLALFLTFIIGGCASFNKTRTDRYVVVLSCDGFRTSYLDSFPTPSLHLLAQQGLQSEFIPCFPSLTFANHYSMATGLYPDHHGLVSNRFYDSTLKKRYAISDRKAVEDPIFYGGEPLWNTAARQGLRTAAYFWVGSETAINGRWPHVWKKYDASVSFQARADSVISWLQLQKNKRPRLVMWYLDQPDHAGHRHGPNGAETRRQVQRVDSVIGYFYNRLKELPIANKVDFLIVSDHGMAALDTTRYVNLNDYLHPSTFEAVIEGVPAMLYLKDKSKVTAVLDTLQKVPHVRCYAREQLPQRLKYGTHNRVGDIVIIPEIGGMVQFRNKNNPLTGGAHGYDNQLPEMRAIFIAVGPDFKPNSKHAAVPNITLYPLVCKLLGIQPAHTDASPILVKSLLHAR